MKKINIFVFLLFLVCTRNAFTQPDPITIQFVEAQPLWEHLVWDTTFYKIASQPGLNKYNTVEPHQCFRFSNDLFISSYCLNYNGEIYGYILEKVDIQNGEIKWQSYNTYYNNGLQDYYKNLYLLPNGDLEMIGIKRHGPYLDSLFAFWNTGGGKSNFIRKDFDYNSGNLLQSYIGKDSIGHIAPTYLNFYPIKFDSTYLAVNLNGGEENGVLKYGYDFFKLNYLNDLENTLPISTILYETSDSITNVFSYGQPQYTEQLDDTTLVGLIFQDKLHPDKTKAQLIWMNIKNLDNIKVIKRLNIENYIPGQANFQYLTFTILNNSIYLTQPCRDEHNVYTAFLTCFDRNGNLIHNIPKCTENNNNYESISLIYGSNNYDYIAGFPSRTGYKGFDILKLNRGSNTFEFISSLTSAFLDENFALQMEVSKLYDDGLFVIGAYTKKLGPVQNSAVKYYCFKGADLGMNINTSVKRLVNIEHIKVYPNPMDDYVTMLHAEGLNVNIYNLDGQIVLHKCILAEEDIYELSIKHLNAGIYFLKFFNDSGNIIEIKKCIKM